MSKGNAVKEDTRECIATALVRLSAKKPLSSISITELCREAGVSRMAFYRNFDSKEGIFAWKIESIVDKYSEVTASARAMGSPWFGIDHLSVCFVFFKNNSDIIASLHRCGCIQLLVDAIRDFVIGTWGNGTPEGDYVLTAFVGSIMACYQRWCERDFLESPQQLAEILSRFYTTMPTGSK